MIIKTLTQVGNPVIRKKSTAVKNIKSKKTQKIIKDLTDSMRYGNLVGLAAPQIGINERIFVTEIRTTKLRKVDERMERSPLQVYINPRLTSISKKTLSKYEGCGSVALAKLFGRVPRATSLTVEAQDKNGKPFELKASGILARVILHELDHLNGIIFLDRMIETKSLMSVNEYRKKI
jgi:peptide deformylase